MDEPNRSRVIEAENKPCAEFSPRFTYAVHLYDSAKIGDRPGVGYRAFRDGGIQVWTVNRKS